jgi:hypothetical protein
MPVDKQAALLRDIANTIQAMCAGGCHLAPGLVAATLKEAGEA